jgi:hypothetical protein
MLAKRFRISRTIAPLASAAVASSASLTAAMARGLVRGAGDVDVVDDDFRHVGVGHGTKVPGVQVVGEICDAVVACHQRSLREPSPSSRCRSGCCTSQSPHVRSGCCQKLPFRELLVSWGRWFSLQRNRGRVFRSFRHPHSTQGPGAQSSQGTEWNRVGGGTSG